MKGKSYRVVYERDEDGWWVASVPSVQGCHTQGRSIDQARERIREALSLFRKDAATAKLVDDIVLPAETKRLLAQQQDERSRAERQQERAYAAMQRAIDVLAELGLSNRDAGQLVGLSHQRVQQLRSKSA